MHHDELARYAVPLAIAINGSLMYLIYAFKIKNIFKFFCRIRKNAVKQDLKFVDTSALLLVLCRTIFLDA